MVGSSEVEHGERLRQVLKGLSDVRVRLKKNPMRVQENSGRILGSCGRCLSVATSREEAECY